MDPPTRTPYLVVNKLLHFVIDGWRGLNLFVIDTSGKSIMLVKVNVVVVTALQVLGKVRVLHLLLGQAAASRRR